MAVHRERSKRTGGINFRHTSCKHDNIPGISIAVSGHESAVERQFSSIKYPLLYSRQERRTQYSSAARQHVEYKRVHFHTYFPAAFSLAVAAVKIRTSPPTRTPGDAVPLYVLIAAAIRKLPATHQRKLVKVSSKKLP